MVLTAFLTIGRKDFLPHWVNCNGCDDVAGSSGLGCSCWAKRNHETEGCVVIIVAKSVCRGGGRRRKRRKRSDSEGARTAMLAWMMGIKE